MNSLVGRADLLRAWLRGGETCARDLALLMKMSEQARRPDKEPPPRAPDKKVPGPDPPPPPPVIVPAQQLSFAPIPFLQVTRRESIGRAAMQAPTPTPLCPSEIEPTGTEPAAAPAVPWSSLRARLDDLLALPESRWRLSLPELIESLARRRPATLRRRRRRRVWPGQIRVVVDRDNLLAPLWADQTRLVRRLMRLLGRDGVLNEVRLSGPKSPVLARSGHRVAPGAPSLVLTGWTTEAGATRRLRGFLDQEDAWGLRGRRVAFLAAGPAWTDTGSLPREVLYRPWACQGEGRGTPTDALMARWILERVLAVPVFFEPGLLRALRLALTLPGSGVATELSVWRGVEHQHPLGGTLATPRRLALQRELTEGLCGDTPTLAHLLSREPDLAHLAKNENRERLLQLEGDLRRACHALLELLSRWRVAASWAIAHEELLTLDVCFLEGDASNPVSEEQRERARTFVERAAASTDPALASPLRGWLERSRERAHWRLAARHPILAEAWDTVSPPAVVTWRLTQRGFHVAITAHAEGPGVHPIGAITTTRALVTQSTGRGDFGLAEGLLVAIPGESVTWSTDREHVHLASFRQEDWMSAWGAGPEGFWIEVGERFERVRFLWQPPEEPLEGLFTEGAFRPDPGGLPGWAKDAGIDTHGAWADVEVKGVVQRFRWVPPGSFAMGSPEGEVGRFEDETLHDVELTAGFWLGDTPCTQAFFTAVMGETSSRFHGHDLPADGVSWDDAESFVGKLNATVPGLGARLPTEAEWEFACRAGTVTATYVGDLTDETKDPLLDRVAWYYGNATESTHPVRQKEPNRWGFHDMLGNVYEWCADWYGEYPTVATVDPAGPPKGAYRVLRGGSWHWLARLCRAAHRSANPPGDRYGWIGFRLSRGQGFVSSGGGATDEGAAEPETGRDAPRRRSHKPPPRRKA